MAIENKYVNPQLATGELAKANINGGSAQLTPYVATVNIASADDNGSIYRLFTVNSQSCVYELFYLNEAITGGTSFDIGIYETLNNGGAVVNKSLFTSAVSLATASTLPVYGLLALTNANRSKSIAELLAFTRDPNKQYDLCLTANVVGTVSGIVIIQSLIA